MSPTDLSLEHLIRPSKSGIEKPSPLFMLHGYGSNEEDLYSFASELPEELFIISIRAPYPMEPFGNAWYAIHFDAQDGKWSDDEQAVESRERITTFLDEACKAYDLNEDKITLLGFSQGTILSFSVALSYPEKIKNVIGLSGYINEGILLKGYQEKDHSKLNIYSSHGQVDAVIPLEWAQRTPDFLNQLGIENKFEEFPVGHGVSPQNFYSFRTWLEKLL
ncbi:alpha/beta hydrolase [Croceivirga thetidis]|uniref:Alpha/beta fold hydrolase n=1 Tax=Croceivirga thetidis TaxID=2721623 RepID=A0ABX1GQF9_9FLAO|nr:alpha/beta fold hydrolase [Croceivirga thetidis]NKI32153.1 alpha/beta fold hydrolase [Croceivirga thetidis]